MPVPFAGTLEIAALGERQIVMARKFDAPRTLVFDAFTKPDLLKKWLLGPPGWSMPVCEIDLKVGGRYRYEWKKAAKGESMGVSGVYRDVSPPARLVHTERFDEAWYPGEALITSEFVETRGGTSVTMTMLLESLEARDGVLKSGMEGGVRQSYDRLAEILDEPGVVRTQARPAAVIRLVVPRTEMPKVMGPAISEIKGALASQGVAAAGPVFARHLRMDAGTFDFEVGVPVASPVGPLGRVRPGELPGARVVRRVYTGPYEGLHRAWGEFDAWMKAHGLAPADDLWEVYSAGPESVPDAASYRTELNRPLVG